MGLTLAIGVATGCVYALVAVGYSLIYRTTGVVNFAQGGYIMIGGFATWWFFSVAAALSSGDRERSCRGDPDRPVALDSGRLPLWRRRSPPYVVLLHHRVRRDRRQCHAAAAGNFAADFAAMGSRAGVRIRRQPHRRPSTDSLSPQVCCRSSRSACVPLISWLGRAMRACATSRDTSQLLGISPERIGALSFAATAALGGFGGAIITPAQFTSSEVGLAFGVFGFVAAVLGGFGSLLGALVGGLLLGVVNALVGRYVSSNYQTVIAFGNPAAAARRASARDRRQALGGDLITLVA